MASFFRELGKLVAPSVRKANWMLQELAGTDAQAMRAEYEVGRDLALAFTEARPLSEDAAAARLVESIGDRLVARVKNKQRKFRFQVVQSPEINAFALPGGFVFVTRPLLHLCAADDDQVAALLGHEMAHVIRSHAKDRMMNSSLISIVGKSVLARGPLHQPMRGLLKEFLESGLSQEQELDADELGVRLAHSAGFELLGGVRMLQELERHAADDSAPGNYFSSHPPLPVRIANLKRFSQNLG